MLEFLRSRDVDEEVLDAFTREKVSINFDFPLYTFYALPLLFIVGWVWPTFYINFIINIVGDA